MTMRYKVTAKLPEYCESGGYEWEIGRADNLADAHELPKNVMNDLDEGTIFIVYRWNGGEYIANHTVRNWYR